MGRWIIFWPHEKPKLDEQALQKYYAGAETKHRKCWLVECDYESLKMILETHMKYSL